MSIIKSKNLPGATYSTIKYKTIIWSIIGLGIALRLFHYFNDRSFWEDEIYLSTGLVKLSLGQLLTHPLDFQQKAPIGYLLIVKLFTLLFGDQEMGLRLFPLLCGIASLLVFKPVAEYFLKPVGAIVALTVLAFAPPLVYHAVEAKQYCTELLTTIIILYTYTRYQTKTDVRSLIVWGIWGAIIVWFSYSSVFVLAGLAFVLGLKYLLKKDWQILFRLIIPFALWLGSFAINYKLFTQQTAHTGWLVYFFVVHDAFMPLSFNCTPWLLHKLFAFFNYPMGFSWFTVYNNGWYELIVRMAWLPLIFCCAGVYSLYNTDKKLLVFIVSTFIIVFTASAIKLYPFHERLTVFLAPLFILLIATGCQAISFASRKNLLQCILIALLLFGPIKNSIAQLLYPGLFGDYKKAYHREALAYLNKNYRQGDKVYVFWNDLPAWNFYKMINTYKYAPVAIEGTDYRYTSQNFDEYFSKLDNELRQFDGKKRVWIVHNNSFDIEIGDYIGQPKWYYQHNDAIKQLDEWLSKKGKMLQEYTIINNYMNNVTVRLMDFSQNNKHPSNQ